MLADDAGMVFRESHFEALSHQGGGGPMATFNFLNFVNFRGGAPRRLFSARGS
jgi:hypothetical protein